MLKISHRINTIDQLKNTPLEYGVEMDLHAYGDRLVVHHDAFADAIDFEDWLKEFKHALVILNVKEEGVEQRVRQLMLEHNHHNFFMLDLSFPALIKMLRAGESRVAVRVSHYEPVEGALNLPGNVDWVWLDLFNDDFPLSKDQYHALRNAGRKICLVSPELHGRDKALIEPLRDFLKEKHFEIDAVCTKYPEMW
jgi:hypothetical protein